MKIVIVAGGTGGHIYPGVALADEIKTTRRDCELLFVGGNEGLEKEIVPRAGYPIKIIAARAMLRKMSYKALSAPFVSLWGFFQAVKYLVWSRADMVVCTGGYVSLPVCLAALLCKKPLYLMEQNVPLGLTNRFFGRWAKKVFLSFAESLKYFPGKVVGNPVRQKVISADRDQARAKFGFSDKEIVVLVTGGSQGAHKINQVIIKALPQLSDDRLRIIHIVGERDSQKIDGWLNGQKYPGYRYYSYLHDMSEAIAAADLVISRAGATAIAEFLVRGLPMILIPFPFSAEGHQDLNAGVIAKGGAAVVINNQDLTTERLVLALGQVKSCLPQMKACSLRLAKPNAAKEIVNEIIP